MGNNYLDSNSSIKRYNTHAGSLFSILLVYIYILCLSGCLSVLVFDFWCVSNKHRNGWTDRAQLLCGTSHDPREGSCIIKISKIGHQQNLFLFNFENPQTFFFKFANFFCFCFSMYTKRNVHNWNGRCVQAAKRPGSLVSIQ